MAQLVERSTLDRSIHSSIPCRGKSFRNNLGQVVNLRLLRSTKPFIPSWVDKLEPASAGGQKSFARQQGARMHHETYAAYRRIWLVHTRQMSPLGAVISPCVIPVFLSLIVKRALVFVRSKSHYRKTDALNLLNL